MKEIRWMGSSYKDVCNFPIAALRDAGYQLHLIQSGLDPADWKPMTSAGQGVREIRLHQGGEHRIIYIAKFDEAVYVLHAFQKKVQRTAKQDIEIAKSRLRDIEKLRSR